MSTPERVIAAVKQSRMEAEAQSQTSEQQRGAEKLRIKELRDNAGDTFAKALRMGAVSQRIDEIIEAQLRAGQTKGYIAVRGISRTGWKGYEEGTRSGLEPLLSALGALLSYETTAVQTAWHRAAHEWSVERYQSAVRLSVEYDPSIFRDNNGTGHLGLFWKMV